MRKIDIQGQVFGSWTVLEEYGKTSSGEYLWKCKCVCGSIANVGGRALRKGRSTKCKKCWKSKLLEGNNNRKHGKSSDHVYYMFKAAKQRAKKHNLPFDISLEDIVIPKVCPLLGIPLYHNEKGFSYNSPSLDKLVPEKGYTRDNTWVVSMKANALKSNASLEELKLLVKNLEEKINSDSRNRRNSGNH